MCECGVPTCIHIHIINIFIYIIYIYLLCKYFSRRKTHKNAHTHATVYNII